MHMRFCFLVSDGSCGARSFNEFGGAKAALLKKQGGLREEVGRDVQDGAAAEAAVTQGSSLQSGRK